MMGKVSNNRQLAEILVKGDENAAVAIGSG
jgi:hypothetical protein